MPTARPASPTRRTRSTVSTPSAPPSGTAGAIPIPIGEVYAALQQLSDRCLYKSLAWLSELYAVLVDQHTPDSSVASMASRPHNINIKEESLLLRARSLFPLHEYTRAAAVLKVSASTTGHFLRYYGRYLDILQCARTSAVRNSPATDAASTTSPVGAAGGKYASNNGDSGTGTKDMRLRELRRDITATLADGNDDDGYLLYLKGSVARRLGLDAEARECLLRSVCSENAGHNCRWNWGAWLELARVTPSVADARTCADTARGGIMGSLYIAHVCNENDSLTDARKIYERIIMSDSGRLDSWCWARCALALVLYNTREFDSAEAIYEAVLFTDDKFRLAGCDIYSNILFVKEDKFKLSQLAHRCMQISLVALETCVVIGNYMSLRQQHEEAVVYFTKALKLNPAYLSAWTLMGHEYVELKNPAMAIQAYRKAVDINDKDFRAWYGLGQTYELMQMPAFTLYYFRKAASLRPDDARMWNAVGHTYEELERIGDARRSYQRALRCDPDDTVANAKLEGLGTE